MSRRLNQTYRSQELSRLARQLLFAPPSRRREQILRAERLHDELDPAATYPLDYLTWRITHYRLESQDTVLLVGEAVAADLRLIIDSLSRSFSFEPEPDETLETINQLAERLHVSVKTVERWRKQGLRWRWVAANDATNTNDGQPRIMIPAKALERFSQLRPKRVEAGSAFTQLPKDERTQLINRARRIASRVDISLNRLATHLAEGIDRAPETVRFILEKHDQRNPANAIFPDRQGPLTTRQKRVVTRAYRRNISVAAIAERFHRGRSTIYRAINETRLAEIRRIPLTYHESRVFDREGADEHFQIDHDPGEIPTRTGRRPPMPEDLPEALRPLYERALPEPKELRHRLLRYHYLKYRADMLRRDLAQTTPKAHALDTIDRCLALARSERSRLVRANLPVMLSVARRQLLGQSTSPTHELNGLLEQGNLVLIDALEAHDPSRSQWFDAFLTNRLLQAYARQNDPETSSGSRRAHRRETGEQILQRMQTQAAERAVDLTIP